MKCLNRKILYIETVLAVLSFGIFVPVEMHRIAERYNSKAVRKAESSPEEAFRYLEKAVKLNPRNPVCHLNLGLLLSSESDNLSLDGFLQGNYSSMPDSVVSEFEKAVLYSEKEPIPLMNMAIINALDGNEAGALYLLSPLLEQDFCWDPVRILYGILAERSGDSGLALETYANAAAQAPIILESPFYSDLKKRNPLLAESVAVLAKNKVVLEYDRARHPLNTAVLGEMEFIDGDVESAEKHLKEALSSIPSMNRPWLFLGRIEEARGNLESAIECYDKAAQLDEYDALPVFFKAKAEGKASVTAEQMQSLLSLEQRVDLQVRYGSAVMVPSLIVKDFEKYCSYDYVTEMEYERYGKNVSVLNDVLSSLSSVKDSSVRYLAARIAEKMLGIPYESGLLDVYPEKLRVYLDKTDNLHFVENCLAIALTAKCTPASEQDVFSHESHSFDTLCNNIRLLRYRNGTITKFSDRLFYFSEWSEQAKSLGVITEISEWYGHKYNQSFSYLSEHLMYLPQIGHEPKALDETKEIEKKLAEKNPFYVISPDKMDSVFYDCLQTGDIVAFVSDRRGEDVSKVGFISRNETSINFIDASYKDKKVVSEDFKQLVKECRGIRLFRVL